MGTRLATSARNAAADAIVDLCDVGGAGSIRVYTGSQPTTPNDAATGTLLATFTLSATAFGASSSGVATLSGTPKNTTGLADGTAGWFRAYSNGATAAVFDGTVTATGGGGQIELNTTAITTGVSVELTSGTMTMPLGS